MAAMEQHRTDAPTEADELPVGTVLLRGSYTVSRFIASGGFGKTYLATDNLDRTVVIKECFPSAFCCRSGENVVAMSRASEQEFKTLVDLFKIEARNLSRLDHPNIVKVHQVFDDNNTAYMVLDYIDGRDLGAALDDHESPLTPEDIQSIAGKLLDAIATIHDADVLHRDISPDNILLTQENEPILIDFGAARQLAVATSRKLSAMRTVKDGYSPQEFYSSGDAMHFASDLYSLAASLHHAIVGYPPPISQERVAAVGSGQDDPYLPIALQARGYDRGLLEAIDRALSLFPIDRPQTAKEWRQLQKGLRIPDRSGRKRQDSSLALIKQIVEGPEHAPVSAAHTEFDDVLRALRDAGDVPEEKSAKTGFKIITALSLALLAAAAALFAMDALNSSRTPAAAAAVSAAAPVPEGTLTLSDGTLLAPHQLNGQETTRVLQTPAGGATQFRRGDVLVTVMPDRTPIAGPDTLSTIIDAAAEEGRDSLNVAVSRDGAMYMVQLSISDQ